MKQLLRWMMFLFCALMMLQPLIAQVNVVVAFEPPALPIYEQPLCPGDGYLWTPGYWGWADDDYFWVPGTWVLAPEPGFLWTPAWWGWEDTGYIFHEGFWGPEVGFYGGINYGFGYFGVGFGGGRWEGSVFRYNTAVLNVNTTIIHNTYIDRTVIVNNNVTRVSYNGGRGGIQARPTSREQAALQQRHLPPVAAQTQHIQEARQNLQLRASANQGKPPIAATERPGELTGRNAVAAREAGAPYRPPARNGAQPAAGGNGQPGTVARPGNNPSHARDLQQHQFTPPNSGNPKMDKKYQQEQQKLIDKQNQEHLKLQQQQEKEDQKAAKQAQNQQRQQVTEQKHQQQTQQLEQRHTQQMQQLQERQAPPPRPAPRPR